MKITKIDHTNNNYSVKQNQYRKQNPTFGKLIFTNRFFDAPIPIKYQRAILKNKELLKLVKMFHEIGKDIEVSYDNPCKKNNFNDCLFFGVRTIGGFTDIVFLFQECDIQERINNLEDGFAEKTFNKFQKEQSDYEKSRQEKQELINSVNSFNESLEPPKQSFWKKIGSMIKNLHKQ